MQDESRDEAPADESDDRFPSGPWEGYSLQRALSAAKGRMELDLTFRDGQVRGGGRDGIGPFTIAGGYETADGKVWWRKRYRYHAVFYRGYAEARGIWGVWEIDQTDRDGFHVWPKGRGAEGRAERREEAPPVTFEVEAETLEPVGAGFAV